MHRDRDAMARNAMNDRIPRVPNSASSSKHKEGDKVITYCLGENRVYVALQPDHESAINLAYEVFPTELHNIPRTRVQFLIAVKLKDQPHTARVVVSRTAWSGVISQMRQFEIIYVHVLPPDQGEKMTSELLGGDEEVGVGERPPPRYESGDYRGHLGVDTGKRSRSGSRSRASSREGSPSLGDRVKSWFKNESD